jgi:membrane protease YdiL (CAAX protease family)
MRIEPRWGVSDAVVSLMLYVAIAASAGIGLPLLLGGEPTSASIVGGLLASWLGLAGWPLLVAWRKGNGPRFDYRIRLTWSDVGAGLLGALVVVTLGFVYIVALLAFTDFTPTSAAGRVVAEVDGIWLYLLLLLIAVGAPLVEEVHFRGLWYAALRKRGVGPWPTVMLTALLFAVLHLEPLRTPLLLTSGVVLGYLRMSTGRLGACIVGHALVNSLGALALLLAT